jgi:hypothetical protein
VREPAKKAPARKNTRSWCKGKVGVEHIPVLVLDHTDPQFGKAPPCRWAVGWSSTARKDVVYWRCPHHEVCGRCGKVLRDRWSVSITECPDYPGDPQQHAAADADLAECEKRRATWEQHRRRKPDITGPQGYRRKRAPSPAQ